MMNGAELLLKTAMAGGVEICFANAGTTEVPVVAALDAIAGIRPVLGLFEGVCTGAADGYGRMRGVPAMNLLHLGPGLGNGIANLHNARRARTPIINLIGEHASWHVAADAPLTMDIAGLSRTVSGWQRQIRSADDASRDMAEALSAAAYGQIATLIAPADAMWEEASNERIAVPAAACDAPDEGLVAQGARCLKEGQKTALLLGGRALARRGLVAAARLRAALGCDLLSVTFPPRVQRGAGLPLLSRLPYFPKQAMSALAPYDTVILVGTEEPVAFFGYKGGRSRFLDDRQRRVRIDADRQDGAAVLEALAEAVAAPVGWTDCPGLAAAFKRPDLPTGRIDAEKMCQALAALQPEGAIVVEEAPMSGFLYHLLSPTLSPHTVLTLTGGAIGFGMPCALGAALACPDRPVINIEADGSALYTVQALWSQAREGANVTTLLCNNRKYATIGYEYRMAQNAKPAESAASLIDLDRPGIGWAQISQGMGVPAVAVDTAEALSEALQRAFAEPGPHLVEVLL
jgi:acetolactate synthase-1/2/3 large subunit